MLNKIAAAMIYVPLLCTLFTASAEPVLRLSNTVVGPVQFGGWSLSVAGVVHLDIHNIGDGVLSPRLTTEPEVSWLAVSLLSPPPDTRPEPIRASFLLDSRSMAPGTYSTTVTVSDPAAADSPQTLIVIMQVLPAGIEAHVAPGKKLFYTLAEGNYHGRWPITEMTTEDNGPWLSLAIGRMATIVSSYSILLAPPQDMAPGTYHGSVLVKPDRTIPVTMHLTNDPVVSFNRGDYDCSAWTRIAVTLAVGGPAVSARPLLLHNRGMGILEIHSATSSSDSISASVDADGLSIVADPAEREAGVYAETVRIECNASNCPLDMPVFLRIAPRRPPLAYNAFLNGPGSISFVEGEQFTFDPPVEADQGPLPKSINGVEVLFDGSPVPISALSFNRLGFFLPVTARDYQTLQVVRNGERSNVILSGLAMPRVTEVTDFDRNPLDDQHSVRPGQSIIIWATGLGQTEPVVPDGHPAPMEDPAHLIEPPVVELEAFGRVERAVLTPIFAGLDPGSIGIYRVVVTIPAVFPSGKAQLRVSGRRILHFEDLSVR